MLYLPAGHTHSCTKVARIFLSLAGLALFLLFLYIFTNGMYINQKTGLVPPSTRGNQAASLLESLPR